MRLSSNDSQHQLSESIIEERGPPSQAARARGEKQGYSSLVGVSDSVYLPLRPGQPSFRKDYFEVLISIKFNGRALLLSESENGAIGIFISSFRKIINETHFLFSL